MKRFLSAGEGYVQNSLTYKLLLPFTRYIQTSSPNKFGWLAYPSWVAKVTGIRFLVALFSSILQYASRFTRFSTGYSSSPSRSVVEAQSKDCRSPLEGLSKRTRTTVEADSNNSRRNAEQLSKKLDFIRPLHFSMLLILFSVFIGGNPVFAQEAILSSDIHRVSAGQKLPDEFWTTEFQFYDHEKTYTKTLEEYKGKPIILSFWMIYCGPCMASFPILNNFKAKYGDDLVILPVNSVLRDSVPVIVNAFARYDGSFRMPGIVGDEYLKHLFPHGPIPHYVWIQADGNVAAVTRRTFVNEFNIETLIQGYGKE